MGTAAAEEKRTLTLHETKIRDLQTRSLALQDIDKVGPINVIDDSC